jgi:DNA gyrase subunit A
VLDLIAPEDVVVTLSHTGYIKRQPASSYRAQKRGGKGRSASALKDEDFVEQLWVVNTHDTLLTFTSTGRVYWLKVYQMPEAGPGARGKPIVNLLPLGEGEKVQAVLPVREYTEDRFVFFATRHGTVKKTPLTEFAFQLQKGKIAIKLDEGDALVNVELTDGNSDILLFASNGKVNRFDENTVRSMGRTAPACAACVWPRRRERGVADRGGEGAEGRHPHRDRTWLRQAHRTGRIPEERDAARRA